MTARLSLIHIYAELAALFAPRPMLVVSDGGDWTATVPRLEYPYLQRIYGFYGVTDKVSNRCV